jgi:DNA modification methylase
MTNSPRIRVRTPVHSDLQQLAASTAAQAPAQPFDLSNIQIVLTPLTALRLSNRKLRRTDEKRIQSHADCMLAHKSPLPILALRNGEIVDGEDTAEAYRLLGQTDAPAIFVDDRPPAEVSALRLWLDRHRIDGERDIAGVKLELETICAFDPDWLVHTHYTMPEIDFALYGEIESTPAPNADLAKNNLPPINVMGDLWAWSSGHRMMCGNAREPETIVRLMADKMADLLATDPPYGTTVAAISGSHAEWKEGSGMSDEDATTFHSDYLRACLPNLRQGALVYGFMDWKGLYSLLTAVRAAGLTQKTLCTWDKQAVGHRGGLYANQSEHIVVAQHGKPAKGATRRGRRGRTTIWSAPGYASFRPDRTQALKDHACTKPQSILMDLLLDASDIDQICLDPFGGSGSMMLAAQRTRRRCYSVDIEERFCDIAIRRMHELTGEYPTHVELGLSFAEVAALRGIAIDQSAAAPLSGGSDDQDA